MYIRSELIKSTFLDVHFPFELSNPLNQHLNVRMSIHSLVLVDKTRVYVTQQALQNEHVEVHYEHFNCSCFLFMHYMNNKKHSESLFLLFFQHYE